MERGGSLRAALLVAVLAIALGVRLWALHSLRFDGLYGQDAYAYYYQGVALWRDHLTTYHWPWLPRPIPFFWPLGEPALLAVLFALAGRASAALAVAGSVGAGVAIVGLVYGLTLRVADAALPWRYATWAAALAAAMTALGGLQVQASTTIMSDAPAELWGLAAVWLWTLPGTRSHGSVQSGAWRAPFAAGVCAALAIVTRWQYALLAPALVVYWWAGGSGAREQTGRLPRGLGNRSGPWPSTQPLPAGLAGALLPGVPQVLVSIQHGDPVLRHQWLVGWSLAHIWQAHFVTVDGAQNYPLSVGAFYLLRPFLSPLSLPATMAPFLPLGIAALAWARNRPLLLLLLCWWLAPALYLAGVPFESDRFTLIFLPPLAILEAVGFVTAVALAARLARTRGTRFRWCPFLLGVTWAALSLGILATHARRPVAALAAGKAGDQAAVAWLHGHAPPGARIATFSLTLTLYHYGDLAAHRWLLLDLSAATPGDLARAAHDRRLVVVANVENLAAQWRGLAPENALRWLLAHAPLRRAGQAGAYTIFTWYGA